MRFEGYFAVRLFLVCVENGVAVFFPQGDALEVNGDSCGRGDRRSFDWVHHVLLVVACDDVGLARQKLRARGCRAFLAQALALPEQRHG